MRSFGAGLVLLGAAACGGATTPPAVNVEPTASRPVSDAPEASKGDYSAKLAEARRVRDEILGEKVPHLAHPTSRQKASSFVAKELKEWFEAVKPRVTSAELAYAAAHEAASTSSERAVALRELADVDASFVERFLAAGENAMPDEWLADTELAAAYRSSLSGAMDDYVRRAREVVLRCDGAAPGDAQCRSVGDRVAVLERAATATPVARPRSPRPAPPPRPSAPCRCVPDDPLCSCI